MKNKTLDQLNKKDVLCIVWYELKDGRLASKRIDRVIRKSKIPLIGNGEIDDWPLIKKNIKKLFKKELIKKIPKLLKENIDDILKNFKVEIWGESIALELSFKNEELEWELLHDNHWEIKELELNWSLFRYFHVITFDSLFIAFERLINQIICKIEGLDYNE